jgi:hypothetical protein
MKKEDLQSFENDLSWQATVEGSIEAFYNYTTKLVLG